MRHMNKFGWYDTYKEPIWSGTTLGAIITALVVTFALALISAL